MKNVQDKKRANKSLPFFFRDEFKVFFVTKPLTVDKTTGIPNSVAVGTLLNFSILLLAKTPDTHKVPSSISVTASPKFKTPTSISL